MLSIYISGIYHLGQLGGSHLWGELETRDQNSASPRFAQCCCILFVFALYIVAPPFVSGLLFVSLLELVLSLYTC